MAVGMDFGTSILVVARKDEDGKTVVKSERNCFIDVSTEGEEMLAGSNYIKDVEAGEEKLFVIGKDAIKLANITARNDSMGERKSGLRRPMAKMVINSKTEKKAIQMLRHMAQNLIGKPDKENEVCVVSIPANPLDNTFSNTFHEDVCLQIIKDMGWDAYPITESLAVVFATNPTTKDEYGEDLQMTGIGISWGAGGTNGCLAYKGKDTIRFALPRGGDWIDEEVSKVTGLTSSEVTVQKEKKSRKGELDLMNPDPSDEIAYAITVYYRSLIQQVAKEFRKEFVEKGTQFTDPIEIVVSGGTSMPKGFPELVEKIVKESNWPFDIKGVRRAQEPLSGTAIGCLNAALSKEKKKDGA